MRNLEEYVEDPMGYSEDARRTLIGSDECPRRILGEDPHDPRRIR